MSLYWLVFLSFCTSALFIKNWPCFSEQDKTYARTVFRLSNWSEERGTATQAIMPIIFIHYYCLSNKDSYFFLLTSCYINTDKTSSITTIFKKKYFWRKEIHILNVAIIKMFSNRLNQKTLIKIESFIGLSTFEIRYREDAQKDLLLVVRPLRGGGKYRKN